jgi:mRNA interferase RelE/StbE
MSYKVILHPEVLEKDLKALSKTQIDLVFKQFKKIQTSPELGKFLGNKVGLDLSGFRKIYVDKKKIRIVYQIIEDTIVVEVIAVGKREDLNVYKKAILRVNK